jgi:hypothetical protein
VEKKSEAKMKFLVADFVADFAQFFQSTPSFRVLCLIALVVLVFVYLKVRKQDQGLK